MNRQICAASKILEAADGSEAGAVWEAHRAEIDLLFTDMVMPGGVTGLDLATRVLADQPGGKVIIKSSYDTDQVDLSMIGDSSIIYLPKPCLPVTLTLVIQECLKRR